VRLLVDRAERVRVVARDVLLRRLRRAVVDRALVLLTRELVAGGGLGFEEQPPGEREERAAPWSKAQDTPRRLFAEPGDDPRLNERALPRTRRAHDREQRLIVKTLERDLDVGIPAEEQVRVLFAKRKEAAKGSRV